jgi:hypothetical protein
VLDARDEGSDLAQVGSRCVVRVWITVAAPVSAAIIGVVGTRISIAERAARCPVNEALPGARDVVVRPANDTVWIVRIDRNRRLVLRGGGSVLVRRDGWRKDTRAIERT